MAKASSKRYLRIIDAARKAATNAYAPYSKIRVGAAVRSSRGRIYAGCNVENSSYPLGLCAERSAVGAAVVAGDTNLRQIALYSPDIEFIVPCGGCIQFLSEFNPELLVITTGQRERYRVYLLKDLLPIPFRSRGR